MNPTVSTNQRPLTDSQKLKKKKGSQAYFYRIKPKKKQKRRNEQERHRYTTRKKVIKWQWVNNNQLLNVNGQNVLIKEHGRVGV